MPSDDGPPPRWRASFLLLGVAGIVVATVFAVVASLAVRPASQVRPFPDMPGPVIADGTTTSTEAPAVTSTVPVPASTAAVIASTTQPTTTTSRKTTTRTTTRTTTTTQVPPPPPPPPPPPKQKPTARIAAPSCSALTCSFDGSGSFDPDGRVIFYSWDFGDGTQGENRARTSHTYAQPGTYTVSLLVMDNDGLVSSTAARQFTVSAG